MTAIVQSKEVAGNSLWGATLLVSGTCIGGGMLALPIQTAETGFFLSSFGLIICWLFMTLTGLFLVEATLWIKNETHFSSMSRILLGSGTKFLALIVYLFMNYASLVAYTAGGSQLLDTWMLSMTGITLGTNVCAILFVTIFTLIVYFGSQLVGKINAILMVALVIAYLGLIGFSLGYINSDHLIFRPTWMAGAGIFSTILSAFSYQMIVPSVCSYLNYDARQLKKAIVLGTTIPAIVYIIWQLVIHGAIPLEGENGLREAFEKGSAATAPLGAHFNHWSLAILADSFAFFAVVTSYLGLSLALFEFLKDCFREIKIQLGRKLILILTCVPVLILAILYPRALLTCFDITGGFGDTILSGLIPIAMVWVGRYRKKLAGNTIEEYTVPGGKLSLVVSALFFSIILIWQFYKLYCEG